MRGSVGRWLVGLTLVYTAGLVGLLLLSWLGLTTTWWLALPNLVAPLLFGPLIVLVPLLGWLHSRRFRVCVGLLILLFVVSFGGLFLPRTAPAPPREASTVRVMTFNHYYRNRDLAAVKAAILRQDADLVGLQELTPEVAEVARRELSMQYPYQLLRPGTATDLTGGLGLLSRFPLVGAVYDTAYRGQRVTVEGPSGRFTLINLHLKIPFEDRENGQLVSYSAAGERGRQLRELRQTVTGLGPLVVIGDFNLSDREADYRALAQLMTDAYRHTRPGFGYTFPAGRVIRGVPLVPLVRLDYVWLKGLRASSAYRDCRSGSDHCLVVADVLLP